MSQPLWMQVNEMFHQHGLEPPPVRLRDKIVALIMERTEAAEQLRLSRREALEEAAKIADADQRKSEECYSLSNKSDADERLRNACVNTARAIAQAIRARQSIKGDGK